jgi:hypothetical protein
VRGAPERLITAANLYRYETKVLWRDERRMNLPGHEVVLMYYSRSRCCKGFEPYTFRFFRDGSFDEGYHVGSKPKVPQNEKGARRLPMSLRVCRSGGDSHALERNNVVRSYERIPPPGRFCFIPAGIGFVQQFPHESTCCIFSIHGDVRHCPGVSSEVLPRRAIVDA